MAERTVPWWRRALNYALEGIRTGFGFFSRTVKFSPAGSLPPSDEIEESAEEERLLPQQPANPETESVEQATELLPAPVVEKTAEDVGSVTGHDFSRADTASESTQALAPEDVSLRVPTARVFCESASTALPDADTLVELAVDPVEPVETPNMPRPISEPIAEAPANRVAKPVPESPGTPVIHTPVEIEPAPKPEAIELAVEQLSEPSEEAEPTTPPASAPAEPTPAKESIPEIVTELESAPIEEKLSIAKINELNHRAEQNSEVATGPEDASSVAQARVPDAETSLAEQHPSEPAIEPLPEPPAVIAAGLPAEPQARVPSPIEAAPEVSLASIEQAAAVTGPVPAAEPPASPAPAAQIQTPPPPETAPAPAPAPPVVDQKAAAKLSARQKKIDEADEESPFSVMVDQVYDGPLDLLLDLIRKQDIDIYDIPIAKITSQFLAYVNQLKASDVDVAGEFIYTASLLIHIKSKMLLPRAPAGPEDAAEDPRRELVERLLEHERFKNAAQMLQQKQLLEAATWTNPGAQEFKDDESAEPEIAADTVDLVRIFRDILERARTRPVIDVSEDQVTVGQMIQFLARRLTMEDKPVALRRLLVHTRSERALIAMFLALLELVRLQAVLLRQDRAFSEIFIKKNTGFDAVMNEGLVNARDDWK